MNPTAFLDGLDLTPHQKKAARQRLAKTGYSDQHRRLRTTMTTYRDRLIAGTHDAPDADQDKSVDDLKEALRVLGQPVSGSKAELEKRLAKAQKNA
jgi:hypothetical protein